MPAWWDQVVLPPGCGDEPFQAVLGLRDIELLYVPPLPELDHVGNIAALLRFRADQSKGGMATVS